MSAIATFITAVCLDIFRRHAFVTAFYANSFVILFLRVGEIVYVEVWLCTFLLTRVARVARNKHVAFVAFRGKFIEFSNSFFFIALSACVAFVAPEKGVSVRFASILN